MGLLDFFCILYLLGQNRISHSPRGIACMGCLPRSQLSIPSQCSIRMGWDWTTWDVPHHPTKIPTIHPIPMFHQDGMGWEYLGCPTPSHQDPNCPSHPNVPSGWDGMGIPGMSHTIPPRSQLSIPSQCSIRMGWDGITWDVPHHPTKIPTVHPIPMFHQDGMGLPGISNSCMIKQVRVYPHMNLKYI